MKSKRHYFLTILIIAVSVGSALAGQSDRHFTVTLLPVMENYVTEEQGPQKAKNLLWIQKTPQRNINLRFDLSVLPSGLTADDFRRCTLRLVVQNVIFQPDDNRENTGGPRIRIKGRLAGNDDNFSTTEDAQFIVALSVLSEKKKPVTLNQETSPEFRDAVHTAYAGEEQKISLKLLTDLPRAGSLFFSSRKYGETPSNIPRLVIEYTVGPPVLRETLSWAQHQQNPEHTGRNPWIPFKNPNGFFPPTKIPTDGLDGSIADYPLIYRGNIYLVNKIEKINYLVALDFKGKEIWREEIGEGTVQRSPVIGRNGIFYAVTADKISAYDLNGSGKIIASYPKADKLAAKLSDYTDLTIGNDGSLFLALKENDVNYIYGFTWNLKPFLKSKPYGRGRGKISTVTVNPDGKKIFAQTPQGAVIIDITNPLLEQQIELRHKDKKALEYHHTPIAGPEGGIMIFSDFTSSANQGNVWGCNVTGRIWSTSDTLVSQPVLGSPQPDPHTKKLIELVNFIQGGALQRHKYDQLGSGESPSGTGLAATSNLVMDGANNIYFWDNGYLHGYLSKPKSLFKEDFTLEGLEEKRPVNQEVSEVIITDGGSGYTEAPTVTFSNSGGLGARAIAVIEQGKVSEVKILEGGSGYTEVPTVAFVGGDGSGALASAVLKKEPKPEEGMAPEQFIRLMLGPDGTLWANNKNGNALFAFKPRYHESNLTLSQEDLNKSNENLTTPIVYRAGGKLIVARAKGDIVTIQKGTRKLFQSGESISFPRGFVVKKGANLLCRTGY
jgi:hypothetical protein